MANKPILYYTPLSQPCRSVLLTAATIGVDLELKQINLQANEHLTPEFLKLNPSHTIPTLDDNGVIITDSHAICTYLCDKYGQNDSLYPKDLAKRAVVDSRLHFDTGVLFARNRFLYEPVLYYNKPIDQERVEYLKKAWPLLEGFLTSNDYLCGNELTVADLCAIATVSSVYEIAPIHADEYPRLAAWVARLQQLPHYEEKNGKGASGLRQLFKDMAAKNAAATH